MLLCNKFESYAMDVAESWSMSITSLIIYIINIRHRLHLLHISNDPQCQAEPIPRIVLKYLNLNVKCESDEGGQSLLETD